MNQIEVENDWRAKRKKSPLGYILWASSIALIYVFAHAGAGDALQIGPEFKIARGVAIADSNTANPGRSSIGYDGQNYLVVSCRQVGTPQGLYGVIVSAKGFVLETFPIMPHQCPATTSIAFDGVNYLVVFDRDGQIYATRVSTSGNVLDGPTGLPVSTVIPFSVTNFSPAVAFDGLNYLVVWQKYRCPSFPTNCNLWDIYGAIVSPNVQTSGEFLIFEAPGDQRFPSVVFDGTNYLVVWEDTRNGSGPTLDTDILGARLTRSGAVLDPSGIPIATAPGFQGEPKVAFDGANYFVVWLDVQTNLNVTPPPGNIFGARVDPSGNLLDGPSSSGGTPINTAPSPGGKNHPAVTFDGNNYIVAWEVGAYPNILPAGIYATRVAPNGQLLSGSANVDGIFISGPACFACRLVHPVLLAGGTSLLMVWTNNSEIS